MSFVVFMMNGIRNARAILRIAFYRANSREFRAKDRGAAQDFARSAQAKSKARRACALWAMLVPLAFTDCAPPPVSVTPRDGMDADAVIPSVGGWYVFRFNSLRYCRFSINPGAWNEQALDSSQKWLEIASPGGAFRPVSAIGGSSGHFYLLDAAQSRLCLYDTAAQLISTFPLPLEMPSFVPGRMEAFRGSDGAFTFLDYQAGEAWQFADRQGGEGGTDWVLQSRVKLPLGIRDCVQEPGTASLACSLPEGPARFDASLNRSMMHHALPVRNATRLVWDPDAGMWSLQAFTAEFEGRPLFRFWPARRSLKVAGNPSDEPVSP